MKRFLQSIVMVLILSAAAAFAQTEEKRIERLSGLGRVWGAVKYFHPFPAYREIDWDKALIETIPKVNTAESPEEYAAAINSMLAALGDQPTAARVEKAGKLNAQNQSPGANQSPVRLENGVLFYDALAASRITFKEYQRLNEFSAEAAKLLPEAKAVLIDARGLEETDAEVLGEIDYEMNVVLPLLLDQTVTLGTIRYRLHNGYATQDGESSGGYYSSLVTDAPKPFSGNAKIKTPPIVFLTDEKNTIAPILGGLQTANKAFVIADGASATGGDFYTLELGEDVFVKIRTTETVNPDGSIGFAPDLIVPKGESLNAARKIIAENKYVSGRPKTPIVPAAQINQKDATYPEVEFPDANYRLLALFRFWNVINYFAPYKDLIGADWNRVLPKYIIKFEADRDASEYRITAQEMVAEIRDSHGFFNAPALKNPPLNFYPPFIEDYAENQMFVKVVLAENSGFKAGDVILETDGAPVEKLIDKYAARIAASTEQALMRDVKRRGIFRGAKDSRVKFKVRGIDGAIREIETIRSIDGNDPRQFKYRLPKRETPIIQILPSGFAYVDLDRLPATNAEINKMFGFIKLAPAVIFDLRGYPRGDISQIAARLSENPPLGTGTFSHPILEGKMMGNPFYKSPSYSVTFPSAARKGSVYGGKVAVLINEITQSAAEGAANNIGAARSDITLIGTPTAGANGDITYGVLPGNIKYGFSGNAIRRTDGRQLQRVGIQPHVRVAPTIRGIVDGKDEILDAAVKFLQSKN